ncbi:hypothetical protein PILCRDRAFT_829992 [Piloderma croceum F 1598]|uniref:Cytochrome P450 n=1 Tax=Piloderma croceum (strain F 1598) TaxID=765440 RepID=A0A0C3B4B1_PILCF|nr:hypothetical protein PILCRDRAFT_829992 [Piloderma croceum F 1598]
MAQLMGWGWNMINQGYGSTWRAQRRTFNNQFRPAVVSGFHPIQMRQVRILQNRLLDTPEDFLYHIRHAVGSIILAVTYGIQVKEINDPYIETAENASKTIGQLGPGKYLVDVLPVLKYVPRWFPGAGFQRYAAYCRSLLSTFVEQPWNFVKDSWLDGTAVPCITTKLLEELPEGDERAEQEQISKHVAAVAYIGGTDTTAFNAQCFVLAMAMYPDVQKKAQAEIDAVIGRDRLPDFNDMDSLPFISAIVKETLRWQPVIPMGVPHYSTQDDEYDGFFIPKGSMVIGNSWSILHDPVMYPEPEEFCPDRFLKDGEWNPHIRDSVAAFGYGRRICPGHFMATQTLFAIISSVLSVFDIFPPTDESGNPIMLRPAMSPAILSGPLPFKCSITPRSDAAAVLIRQSVDTSSS